MAGVTDFRALLDQATQSRDWRDWVRQINVLSEETSRIIRVHDEGGDGGTCFGYAFDLNALRVYECIGEMTGGEVFVDSCFVPFLIRREILRSADHPPQNGSVIIYFAESFGGPAFPLHAGVAFEGKVRSKWGSGPVFEHEAADIPARYGPDFKYFRAVDKGILETAFLEYAEFLIGPEDGPHIVAHCRSEIVAAPKSAVAPDANHDFNDGRNYLDIEIEGRSPDTEIWLGDNAGCLVQKEVGVLHSTLIPGHYVVEFGLGTTCYPITLFENLRLTQREIELGASCERPVFRLGDNGA
jgi:hypothetical protein